MMRPWSGCDLGFKDTTDTLYLRKSSYPQYLILLNYEERFINNNYSLVVMKPEETGNKLYNIFKTMNSNLRLISMSFERDFPEFSGLEITSEAIYHFTMQVKAEDLEKDKDWTFKHSVSQMMQRAIDNGETEFEVYMPTKEDAFPFCVKANGQRAKIAIVGDLGEQAVKESTNLDVAVYGNIGNTGFIGSKNVRGWIEGSTGDFLLDNTENCILDAQSIGYNFLTMKDGKVYVRGDQEKKIFDGKSLIAKLEGAAPLIGNPIITKSVLRLTTLFHSFSMNRVIKKSNTRFYCGGKSKSRLFEEIEYKQPDWIPQRIYSN